MTERVHLCLYSFAQAIVAQVINANQFVIKTDKPNVKVSWMVTGVRNDKWAQVRRVVPEVEKVGAAKAKYLHPEPYGKDKSYRIGIVGNNNCKDESNKLKGHRPEVIALILKWKSPLDQLAGIFLFR